MPRIITALCALALAALVALPFLAPSAAATAAPSGCDMLIVDAEPGMVTHVRQEYGGLVCLLGPWSSWTDDGVTCSWPQSALSAVVVLEPSGQLALLDAGSEVAHFEVTCKATE